MSKVLWQAVGMKNNERSGRRDEGQSLLTTGAGDGGIGTCIAGQKIGALRRAHPARNVRRGAFGRMKRIFGWLQDRMYPNCSKIARELEVSVKTAERDIDYMRHEWALPIAYDPKWNGYYFHEPVNRLPWVPVTEAELFAMCFSSKVLRLHHGMEFQKPLESALSKLTCCLDDEERYRLANLDLGFSFRAFAPEQADIPMLELMSRAVIERRVLWFQYRKPGDKTAELRRVHPYHLVAFEGRMYLLARDVKRRAVRTFALGRMSKPVLGSRRFVVPTDFDAEREFRNSLGMMSGSGDYHVVIEMDAWLTDTLRGRRLHSTQVVDELPGGGSRLSLRLGGLEEIERCVLGWGTHANVLAPSELREGICQTAKQLFERYGGLDTSNDREGCETLSHEP
jgi:predicted DNA-binding transcriptional regulator YafY